MRKLLILITIFLTMMGGLFAQEAWDYPIKPGSAEWKLLKNYKQKVDACQIPNSFIKKMNTNDLVETCLNYPLLRDIFAFNFLQDGVDNLEKNFSGFNELLTREDASKLLFSKYKKIKPDEFNKQWSLVKKGDYAINIMMIEIFLSQREILNTLSKNEKKVLVKELLKKFKEKNDPQVYGRLSQMTIGLCLTRILEQENLLINVPPKFTTKDLILFSDKANLANTQLLPSIILIAENFIK